MIITWLTGGLGNQMFQYAAGLALAEHHRTVLKLDVSWFRHDAEHESHNRYALSCFNVTEQFATAGECARIGGVRLTRTERWSARLARAAHFYQYANRLSAEGRTHYAARPGFYSEFFEQPDDTYVYGMWQSEQFFAPVANLLRLHFSFRYPAQPCVLEVSRRIAAGPSAAVHFRRGDYVRNATFGKEIGVLDLDYYYRAVDVLRARHPDVTLYVFSDDIDSVEREFHPAGPHVFVRGVQAWHAYDTIRLMSQCDHSIIANSTFSWWAAWLNANPHKMVVAPEPWFADRRPDGADIVPKAWVRLPARRAHLGGVSFRV